MKTREDEELVRRQIQFYTLVNGGITLAYCGMIIWGVWSIIRWIG